MQQSYVPSDQILKKYADVLVDVGLGKGKGIKKGDTVWLNVPEVAKPLLYWLHRKVLERGGHPIIDMTPSPEGNHSFARSYYELAKKHHLQHVDEYKLNLMSKTDHRLSIIAETDKAELAGVDGKKIAVKNRANKAIFDVYMKRTSNLEMTRTVGLYGTDAGAEEVGLSPKKYWDQIIKACFLRDENPVKKWRKHIKDMNKIADKLTKLSIDSVHVKSDDIDIHIGIGSDRAWLSAKGDNIPSFEVFTSPDWRRVNGNIAFDMPLYAFGNVVEGIKLTFKDGEVIKSSATKGEDFLKKLLKTDEGARRVGEFSLTDKRHSPINHFMAETLYDENFGGKWGNTHIALGFAYRDCILDKFKNSSEKEYKKRGFNTSNIHEDMFSTKNRVVAATLSDGSEKIIYQNGQFTI